MQLAEHATHFYLKTMNKKQQTINQILQEWGQSQYKTPADGDSLKNLILNKLPIRSGGFKYSRARVPWLSMAMAGMALFILLISTPAQKETKVQPIPQNIITNNSMGKENYLARDSKVQNGQNIMAPEYMPPYPRELNVPIDDSREFLKTDYGAKILTRNISDKLLQIQNTARGLGGRIDGINSSEHWGTINFSIPSDKLEIFRNSIKSLVPSRFIKESISQENLLPQKQSIENQKKETDKQLAQLKKQRDEIVSNHRNVLATIYSQITKLDQEIKELKIKADITSDSLLHQQFEDQIKDLSKQENTLNNQIINENNKYSMDLSSIDSQINSSNDNLEYIKNQDLNLINTVETVHGTITLNWISIWGVILLYIPGYWLSSILAAASIIVYLINKRRSQMIIL